MQRNARWARQNSTTGSCGGACLPVTFRPRNLAAMVGSDGISQPMMLSSSGTPVMDHVRTRFSLATIVSENWSLNLPISRIIARIRRIHTMTRVVWILSDKEVCIEAIGFRHVASSALLILSLVSPVLLHIVHILPHHRSTRLLLRGG